MSRSRAHKVDVVVDARARLGESPLWRAETASLLWVDILGQSVHEWRPRTGVHEVTTHPAPVGAVLLGPDGASRLAVPAGILDPGPPVRLLAALPQQPGVRANDAAVDPAGRIWVGTMALDAEPGRGALHRIDLDGTVHSVLTDLSIPNGMDWTPDGTTMYFAESVDGLVHVFDVDPADGRVVGRRRPIEPPGPGVPDGLCLDADGCLWVAMHDGGCILRLSPDGQVVDTLHLPVARPTSCAFGGEGLDVLYVTSAADGAEEHQRRTGPDGLVLAVDVGATGRPVSHSGL